MSFTVTTRPRIPGSSFARFAGVLGLVLAPRAVLACAVCYGQSDSPMAAGMNWGIFTLLAMILFVLGGVAAFFIFLARRSAAMQAQGLASPTAECFDMTTDDLFETESKLARHAPASTRSASVFAWRSQDCGHSQSRSVRRNLLVRSRNQA